MIRNDAEYRAAAARVKAEKKRLDAYREKLKKQGVGMQEVKRALDPLRSFHLQLEEEVAGYEKLKRGEFEELLNFEGLGRLLIALRIYAGISQRRLAEKLGVHESQVSRDERNEYHGITVERAGKILGTLGVSVRTNVAALSGNAA